jgi:FMN phosphatase YigB (HAD superfamily)
MSITTIVFDFGNVLGFFSHRRAAEQLLRHAPAGVTINQLLAFFADSELEVAFECGRLTTAEVLLRLRRRFGLTGSDEELELACADMFTPNEPVCSLVPRLRERYRLLLLSNTNDLHYRHFRRQFSATLDCFHHLVASHEVGLRKPDVRLYRHAEQVAGARAEQCLFIDDLPANVEAARACGWQAVLYRPHDDLSHALRQVGVH